MRRDIAREIEGTAYEGRQATLDEWTREFNEERPHEALGMKMPAEVYVKKQPPVERNARDARIRRDGKKADEQEREPGGPDKRGTRRTERGKEE